MGESAGVGGSDSAHDRFGFPIGWAVEFARARRAFARDLGMTSDEVLDRMTVRRRALDEKVGLVERCGTAAGSADDVVGGARRGDATLLFLLPFPAVTGGMRVFLGLARLAAELGYRTRLGEVVPASAVVGGDGSSSEADSSSATLRVRRAELASAVRRLGPHATICGSWIDYWPVVKADTGVVLGWSGGEPTLNHDEGFRPAELDHRRLAHELPVVLLTCSRWVQGRYLSLLNRRSFYIPATIDPLIFRPGRSRRRDRAHQVVVVGSDRLPEKGVTWALQGVERARERLPNLELHWITPSPPVQPWQCRVSVGLSQPEIAAILRSSDLLVYTPTVDGLGLPPLEAMAAGVATVISAAEGPGEYAEHETNCLVVDPLNGEEVASAVVRLLVDRELARRVRAQGQITAANYAPRVGLARLQALLGSLGV